MSYALAYLGSLAFVAFVLWLRTERAKEYRIAALEAALQQIAEAFETAGDESRLKALEDTVSTLALQSGLRPMSAAKPQA